MGDIFVLTAPNSATHTHMPKSLSRRHRLLLYPSRRDYFSWMPQRLREAAQTYREPHQVWDSYATTIRLPRTPKPHTYAMQWNYPPYGIHPTHITNFHTKLLCIIPILILCVCAKRPHWGSNWKQSRYPTTLPLSSISKNSYYAIWITQLQALYKSC